MHTAGGRALSWAKIILCQLATLSVCCGVSTYGYEAGGLLLCVSGIMNYLLMKVCSVSSPHFRRVFHMP